MVMEAGPPLSFLADGVTIEFPGQTRTSHSQRNPYKKQSQTGLEQTHSGDKTLFYFTRWIHQKGLAIMT